MTGRDRTGGNLTMDNGRGWAEVVLGSAKGAEHKTD